MIEIITAVIAGVFGLLVGGVINVLADDLPQRRPLGLPRYPDGAPRSPSAWLGLGAFLTGQRVSPGLPGGENASPDSPDLVAAEPEAALTDGNEILLAPAPAEQTAPRPPDRLGWRHPLVEIGSALSFVGLALGFPDEKNLWAWFVYVAIMLLITVIDVEHRLILFVVIVPSCLFALLVAAVSPPQDKPFSEFLIGGAVGFGLFFAMYLGGGVFTMMSRHDEVAFGFGDVMLATLSGLMLGWRAFIFASLITVFAGAAGALFYIVGRMLIRRRYRWFTPLPYGPYIVLGTLLMLFFREQIGDLLTASIY
jgi:leader peptidase (prepilin peptidase)/N-methyltransferase